MRGRRGTGLEGKRERERCDESLGEERRAAAAARREQMQSPRWSQQVGHLRYAFPQRTWYLASRSWRSCGAEGGTGLGWGGSGVTPGTGRTPGGGGSAAPHRSAEAGARDVFEVLLPGVVLRRGGGAAMRGSEGEGKTKRAAAADVSVTLKGGNLRGDGRLVLLLRHLYPLEVEI